MTREADVLWEALRRKVRDEALEEAANELEVLAAVYEKKWQRKFAVNGRHDHEASGASEALTDAARRIRALKGEG